MDFEEDFTNIIKGSIDIIDKEIIDKFIKINTQLNVNILDLADKTIKKIEFGDDHWMNSQKSADIFYSVFHGTFLKVLIACSIEYFKETGGKEVALIYFLRLQETLQHQGEKLKKYKPQDNDNNLH